MKVAVITITHNDGFKTEEWHNHYLEYKSDIYKHIIVDNGSSKNYTKYLEELFKDSIIIKRKINGGTTAAYNDGIQMALNDPLVDSIMLAGNDIKLSKGAIPFLHKKLFENETVGMIAPIIFLKDSSTIIESYGLTLRSSISLKTHNRGDKFSEELPFEKEVDIVPGGMHLSKRKLYEKVGLQDESLFMYSDEIDMGIRIKEAGLKVLVTRDAQSWHQHINESGNSKKGFSYFLQARNKLLLGYKHYSFWKVLYTFFVFNFFRIPIIIRRALIERKPNLVIYYLLGTIFGLFNIKKNYSWLVLSKL